MKNMGHDELLGALEEEGRAELKRIADEAAAEVCSITESAERAALAERAKRFLTLENEIDARRTARVNKALLGAKGAILKVKHELINGAVDEAVRRIAQSDEYPSVLADFYEELLERWTHGTPRVLVNPADVAHLKALNETVEGDAKVSLGVLFESEDGTVSYANTIEGRIERIRNKLLPRLEESLFSE